jgi:FkbM family methyltransferase
MEQLPEFNRVKHCRHGRMLYNINDIYIGRSLDLYGEFSEGEVELFRQMVRPGDVILDVGANIGVHTVFFAAATGPKGAVLAFEPQRLIFQTLCANIALNNFLNVWCMNVALGDAPGSIRVPTLNPAMRNNFGGLSLGSYSQGDHVEVIRLDSLQLGSCRLIKIDVEGMELQVLRGATGLIERFRPALYVENDRTEHSAELIRYIDSLDYDMYWHRPPLFNPANFFKHLENVFGNIVSGNMLCIPKSAGGTIAGLPTVEVP